MLRRKFCYLPQGKVPQAGSP